MNLSLQFIIYLLYIEIVGLLFFIFPIPLKWRKYILLRITKCNTFKKGKYLLIVIYGFILIQFIDSVFCNLQMYKLQESGSLFNESKMDSKRFYVQRNVYLIGFTLFLGLMGNRFSILFIDVFNKEENVEILKKQCLQQQERMINIVEENEQKNKSINELKNVITESEKKIKNYEVIKKQAENQQKEYFQLLDNFHRLEERFRNENKKDK